MSSTGAERPRTPVVAVPGVNEPPAFIDTARALTICSRELDALAEEIARLAKDLDTPEEASKPDVRRAPNRCIVQLGPVALTVSWLRGHSETVSAGRLLVIEWDGVVGRSNERTPERSLAPSDRTPAEIVRETVFRATATCPTDWEWRREPTGANALSSSALAAQCVDTLRERYLSLAS